MLGEERQRPVAQVAALHDLTPVQARLLSLLLDGPRGMADLTQALRVEKAALTGLMDRVERRDLARRTAVPGNRRSLQVTLTDLGRGTALAFHIEVTDEMSGLTAFLDADEEGRFLSTLTGILERNRTAPDRPSSSDC
ncbi:hypothetical protein GCM10022223_10840 [Kineosporia mesophila]|uniref:HTH marR-type domain-containing protein n=1 Tax=Kineosporia mesophila TaxID=566012 RepID=A0ABP6Z427_9ACTN